jgi:hypothetical protein
MLHEYSVQYLPWIHVTMVGHGTYYLWIWGHTYTCLQHVHNTHTAHYFIFNFAILHVRNKNRTNKFIKQISWFFLCQHTMQTDKWVGWDPYIGNNNPSTNPFSRKHKRNEIHKRNLCKWCNENKNNIIIPYLVPTAYFTHIQHHHTIWTNLLMHKQHAQYRERVVKYTAQKLNTMQLFMQHKKFYAGSICWIGLRTEKQ